MGERFSNQAQVTCHNDSEVILLVQAQKDRQKSRLLFQNKLLGVYINNLDPSHPKIMLFTGKT